MTSGASSVSKARSTMTRCDNVADLGIGGIPCRALCSSHSIDLDAGGPRQQALRLPIDKGWTIPIQKRGTRARRSRDKQHLSGSSPSASPPVATMLSTPMVGQPATVRLCHPPGGRTAVCAPARVRAPAKVRAEPSSNAQDREHQVYPYITQEDFSILDERFIPAARRKQQPGPKSPGLGRRKAFVPLRSAGAYLRQ